MAKGAFGIFYIDANKGYLYISSTGATLQVEIPADTLSYFDIINRDKFYQILQTFVTANKIEPCPIVLLIPPAATYEMDITSKVPEEINTMTQQFTDSVPFEKVLSKTYKLPTGGKIFATNKDIYEAIKHGFEKLHFSISAVISLTVLQKMMPDIGNNLQLDVIAGKIDTVKQYSFITSDEINNIVKPNQQVEEKEKPNPMRLYALVGVFVVLIGVLVVLVIVTMQPQKPPVVARRVPVRILTPTPIPSIVPVRTSSASGQVVSPAIRPLVSPTKAL